MAFYPARESRKVLRIDIITASGLTVWQLSHLCRWEKQLMTKQIEIIDRALHTVILIITATISTMREIQSLDKISDIYIISLYLSIQMMIPTKRFNFKMYI